MQEWELTQVPGLRFLVGLMYMLYGEVALEVDWKQIKGGGKKECEEVEGEKGTRHMCDCARNVKSG